MYNRFGRGLLLIVGRQIQRKLCENTGGAAGCTAIVHRAPINCGFIRGYSEKNSDEPPVVPQLLSPDEDAELQMEKILADPENARRLKIIELEVDVMRQNSIEVPETLKPRHWMELLNLGSRGLRRRYLKFLFGLEKKHENQARSKAHKLQVHKEKLANPKDEEETNEYKLGVNSMFLRIYDSTMNHMWHSRLFNRMMFGQQLVLDCSYESYMNRREIKLCAKQLQLTFAHNRVHDDPFDLYFCNANLQGDLMKNFHRFIPTVHNPEFPLNIRSESYLDIFDKKRLIYLTPHCPDEMTTFDHDAVYIIGAFVDKSRNEPVSLAKAKKEGLRMQKFPLDRYLHWAASSGKSLSLNHVLGILLELRLTGSWEKALTYVPRRKLRDVGGGQRSNRRFTIDYFADEEKSTMPYSSTEYSSEKYPSPEHSWRKHSSTEYSSTGYSSSPMQPLKLKERFTYTADKSFRPKAEASPRDFSMKSRSRFKNNWKD